MTLIEVQKHLGDRLKITLDETLTEEERAIENEQTFLTINIAKQMINNGDLILRAEKLAAQNKALTESKILELIG